jgi:MYXO-CTERM domain-containing protein
MLESTMLRRIAALSFALMFLASSALAGPMTDVAPGGCGGCDVGGSAGVGVLAMAALLAVAALRRR